MEALGNRAGWGLEEALLATGRGLDQAWITQVAVIAISGATWAWIGLLAAAAATMM